jgi:hypothetical protein
VDVTLQEAIPDNTREKEIRLTLKKRDKARWLTRSQKKKDERNKKRREAYKEERSNTYISKLAMVV